MTRQSRTLTTVTASYMFRIQISHHQAVHSRPNISDSYRQSRQLSAQSQTVLYIYIRWREGAARNIPALGTVRLNERRCQQADVCSWRHSKLIN